MFGLSPQEWSLVWTDLVKLLVGLALGGVVGWERELHGRPAGTRTHMLVVLGVLLAIEGGKMLGGEPNRVAAQVVTGIGFLGAGTIMRMGPEIKGLTTAASIWATAGIAIAVSVGGAYYVIAVASTLLALFTLTVVDRFEMVTNSKRRHERLTFVVKHRDQLSGVLQVIQENGGAIENLDVSSFDEPVHVSLNLRGRAPAALDAVLAAPAVVSASWSAT